MLHKSISLLSLQIFWMIFSLSKHFQTKRALKTCQCASWETVLNRNRRKNWLERSFEAQKSFKIIKKNKKKKKNRKKAAHSAPNFWSDENSDFRVTLVFRRVFCLKIVKKTLKIVEKTCFAWVLHEIWLILTKKTRNRRAEHTISRFFPQQTFKAGFPWGKNE